MARASFDRFDETTEREMRNFFETLSEKDQRRYAAVQARQLGHGGIEYVSEVLECSTRTISRGIRIRPRLLPGRSRPLRQTVDVRGVDPHAASGPLAQ